MTEQHGSPSDRELEARLADLGANLAFPATPDLAPRVRDTLPRPLWERVRVRALPLAFAAAIVLALATLLVVPDARAAVASRLGVRGIGITFIHSVPSPTPGAASRE